jgi:hypothetical protein
LFEVDLGRYSLSKEVNADAEDFGISLFDFKE